MPLTEADKGRLLFQRYVYQTGNGDRHVLLDMCSRLLKPALRDLVISSGYYHVNYLSSVADVISVEHFVHTFEHSSSSGGVQYNYTQ